MSLCRKRRRWRGAYFTRWAEETGKTAGSRLVICFESSRLADGMRVVAIPERVFRSFPTAIGMARMVRYR
jgi:hypothetical protein